MKHLTKMIIAAILSLIICFGMFPITRGTIYYLPSVILWAIIIIWWAWEVYRHYKTEFK